MHWGKHDGHFYGLLKSSCEESLPFSMPRSVSHDLGTEDPNALAVLGKNRLGQRTKTFRVSISRIERGRKRVLFHDGHSL